MLFVLLLAGLSFALSQTLVVPALPTLAQEYSASPTAASWLLTGFLLSASVATPIVGKLGDLFGKGRVLTAVLVLFSTGSIVCALADSIGLVIAGRVIQGVAGGVFPLAFGIIRDTFPRERVASGIGLLSAVFGIGGGIGLPLSGVIVGNVDVSWLFWVGLIALPAAFAAHRLVPASPPVERTRIDWLGAALLSVALAGLLLGVTEANDLGWTSPVTLALLLGGGATLGVWAAQQSRAEQPLIDLSLLRLPTVALTNLTGMLVGFAMFSSFLLIPQFAQAPERTGYGFGLSVLEAGLLLVPTAAAQLVAGPLAGRLGSAVGFRLTLAGGAGMATLAFAVLALEHSHLWHFVVGGDAARRRDLVRDGVDGEPDRRLGAAAQRRDRDGDQHRDPDRRGRLRLGRGDCDPRGADDRLEPDPVRGRLHLGLRRLRGRRPARRGGRPRDSLALAY